MNQINFEFQKFENNDENSNDDKKTIHSIKEEETQSNQIKSSNQIK